MVAPMIAYNGESTHQGSVPFARGGDTLVAAVPYSQPVPRCGVVWVNITSARNPARAQPSILSRGLWLEPPDA